MRGRNHHHYHKRKDISSASNPVQALVRFIHLLSLPLLFFFLSISLLFLFLFFNFFFRGQLIHNQMQQSGRARAIRLDKRNADLERENDRLRHLYRLLGEMPETEAREVLRRVRAAEDPLAVLNYSRCSFFFFSRTLSYIISFFLLRLLSPLSLRLCVCVSGLLMDGPSSRPKGLNQA